MVAISEEVELSLHIEGHEPEKEGETCSVRVGPTDFQDVADSLFGKPYYRGSLSNGVSQTYADITPGPTQLVGRSHQMSDC